ncbi:outer membrane protein assembly factor BamD [Uliginosibacterium sp. H1]|uniref:outer membrane protein assembly factor BamD n=1 Tax=Uliginosibacterium sp. H1 TaxID=3114757 RepID=UPI002E1910D2|nr:outer membrane protein assembly factor BamD [Uliginosibacterium sp. H1]
MNKLTRASLPVVIAACISACSSTPKVNESSNPAELYTAAKEELVSGNYSGAVEAYERLEARFPYGRYAQQAQLEVAYAYYQQRELGSAIAACDRFIKLNPNHPSVDYAYYLKGLSLENADRGWMSWLSREDMSERDPKATQEAFESFREVVTRYPSSRYAPDARKRMETAVAGLANHGLVVARYYLNRRAPLAAANRAQALIKTYPGSASTEEALGIMITAYGELGLQSLQDDARRVLKLNYPNSRFMNGVSKS